MKAIRLILKMKKAFSLFELIITLVLLGILLALFAKPLTSLSHLYENSQGQNFNNANSSLLFIDKILQKCLKFTPLNAGFECLLQDEQNLILYRENKAFIGSSSILLQDENSSFYAPKSHFIYDAKLENNKLIKAGVLVNQNDLQGFKNRDFLHFYSLKEKQIYKLKVLDGQRVAFLEPNSFKGLYKLVEAKVSILLDKDEFFYLYTPYSSATTHKNLLLNGVKAFSVDENFGKFRLKLCVFNKTKTSFCLEKWSFK